MAKQLLKYLVGYIAIWFAMTQINGFVSVLALYIPVFWVFVFFPAMQHPTRTGFGITLLSGLFFESQFHVFRGVMLPTMISLFLVLHYRRMKAVDSKSGSRMIIASAVHWILTLVPSLKMLIFSSGNGGNNEFLWERTLQDGITGQLFLFLLFPFLSIAFVLLDGRPLREEGSVSVDM